MKTLIIGFLATLSVAAQAVPGQICVGDRVLDTSDNTTGVAVEVFSNNMARVRFDGYSGLNSIRLSRLSRGVERFGRFGIESRVMDESDLTTGRVKELFESGVAKVQFDGYTGKNAIRISRLSLSKECLARYVCVGERVLDSSDNTTGTVRELYDNGYARVQFDGYTGKNSVSVRRLGYEIQCSNGKCQ